MTRITVKDLKEILKEFPEDAIVCLYSDAEGNQMSTMLDSFKETVGQEYKYKDYTFIGGTNVFGIDVEKDKGKTLIFLQPSL